MSVTKQFGLNGSGDIIYQLNSQCQVCMVLYDMKGCLPAEVFVTLVFDKTTLTLPLKQNVK